MATDEEYDLAVLRCYAKCSLTDVREGWGWMPNAARPLRRFGYWSPMHRVSMGVYHITDAGRARLAELEELLCDRDVESIMFEEYELEDRIDHNPGMRISFDRRPGADFEVVLDRPDSRRLPYAATIVYDPAELAATWDNLGDCDEYDEDFTPFVVRPYLLDGHLARRIQGILAKGRMQHGIRHAHRSSFTPQTFHVMRHPVYGDWIRSSTERGLRSKVKTFVPVAASPVPVEEPSEPTAEEIEQDRKDAVAYAHLF